MRERQRDVRQGSERVGTCAAFGGQPQPAPAKKQLLAMSPAVERDALVPAPARQEHPHPRCRRAALHRFLVHLDVYPGEGAVATQHGNHVAGAQGAVRHCKSSWAHTASMSAYSFACAGAGAGVSPSSAGSQLNAGGGGRPRRRSSRAASTAMLDESRPPAQVYAHRPAAQAVP